MVRLEDIKKAKECIKDEIKKTAIINCKKLSSLSDSTVYLKLENLQNTGSFKIRGALNKIASLTEEEKNKGVIASSAGNHAQGVALGATKSGIKATIVMPEIAPLAKVQATKEYGGDVVLHGAVYDDAYAKARELQEELGATFIHPFDDEKVIAGQGTIGLEILEEVKDLDAILVPIGGGGLIAGIAVAAKEIKPDIKIIGVEAKNAASMSAALYKREVHDIETSPTIADGIAVRRAGSETYKIIEKYVDEIVTVSESEIAQAILFLIEKDKIVAEGAGATTVAAILSKKVNMPNKKITAVVSGGNIDVNLMERIMNKALMKEGRLITLKLKILDKAGEMEKLLSLITKTKANIMELSQTMYKETLEIGEQEVKFVLETYGNDHKYEIMEKLLEKGYKFV